jgi:hypothetical protein
MIRVTIGFNNNFFYFYNCFSQELRYSADFCTPFKIPSLFLFHEYNLTLRLKHVAYKR